MGGTLSSPGDPVSPSNDERVPILPEENKRDAALFAKRRHIARELLTTERSYTLGIKIIKHSYLAPLEKSQLVDRKLVKSIFSIIDVVLSFHEILLPSLEERIDNYTIDTCIGDVFVGLVDYLKCYTTYVNNYNNAIIDLSDARDANNAFNEFLEVTLATVQEESRKQIAHTSGTGGVMAVDLNSLLITPVQRIPRYVLLLRDLLKNTEGSHPDHAHLCNALDKVSRVASQIDSEKRHAENLQVVLNIHNSLVNAKQLSLVKPYRRFVSEGDIFTCPLENIRMTRKISSSPNGKPGNTSTPTLGKRFTGATSSLGKSTDEFVRSSGFCCAAPSAAPPSPSSSPLLPTAAASHFFLFNDCLLCCTAYSSLIPNVLLSSTSRKFLWKGRALFRLSDIDIVLPSTSSSSSSSFSTPSRSPSATEYTCIVKAKTSKSTGGSRNQTMHSLSYLFVFHSDASRSEFTGQLQETKSKSLAMLPGVYTDDEDRDEDWESVGLGDGGDDEENVLMNGPKKKRLHVKLPRGAVVKTSNALASAGRVSKKAAGQFQKQTVRTVGMMKRRKDGDGTPKEVVARVNTAPSEGGSCWCC
eukprot:TRINITY_DN330_c1_g1_i1.p1 TRINITY_DN330_c1_g1~~TRINITY_DN330_c1_g1_i1.p1  ORF type:complete len:585 (+),score=92.20 TRINITY_DN330_c1_g1_i1:52-1806(+)